MTSGSEVARGLMDVTESGLSYRVGQISSVAGLAESPPYVTVGEGDFAQDLRMGGNLGDYHPGDTIIYAPIAGQPTVLARLPVVGTDWEEGEGDYWHEIGAAGEPAFAGAWNWFGVPYETPAFRKQSDGWVMIKGTANNGAATSTVFTLPDGYRPPFDCHFIAMGGGITSPSQIRVTTAGVVKHELYGSPGTYLSLDGITFPTKWNPAAWVSVLPEGEWGTDVAAGAEARIFLRDDGWVYHTGVLLNSTTTAGVRHRLMRLPLGYSNGWFAQMLPALAVAIPARLDVGGNNQSLNRKPDHVIHANYVNGNAFYNGVVLGGLNYYSQHGDNNLWVAPTLVNGWTQKTGDWGSVGYHIDAHNVVHLRGLLDGNARTSNTAFTLPAGFRPLARRVFASLDSGVAIREIQINADGTVVPVVNATKDFVTLTGIRFLAEQ